MGVEAENVIYPGYWVGGLKLSMKVMPTGPGMVNQVVLPPIRGGPVSDFMSSTTCEVDVEISQEEHDVFVSVAISDLLVYYLINVFHGSLTLAVCFCTLCEFIDTGT
jgi:hypothetical protein